MAAKLIAMIINKTVHFYVPNPSELGSCCDCDGDVGCCIGIFFMTLKTIKD